jgi:hypothetical protein
MTHTATQTLGHDGAALYELDPLMVIGGHPIRYLMAMAMPARFGWSAETVLFAADAEGMGDATFYTEHGYVARIAGYADIPRALGSLGYDCAPLLSLVSND